ncbi:MAG: tetratricopeptide repeat protein [Polyangiaceae bacterium]
MTRPRLTPAWCVALLAGALATLAVPAPATAQSDANRAAARRLGKEALGLYEQGDYEGALDRFRRAHDLVGLTTTGLYTGRTLEKLGRLVEASELYLEASRIELPPDAPEQHVSAKADARRAYDDLQPRIPQLTIEVNDLPEGASVAVTVDGATVPPALLGVARPTDPGDHLIEATVGGTKRAQRITLAEGARERVTLDMSGAAGTPVQPQPPTHGPGPVSPVPPMPDEPPPADTGSSSVMATVGWVAIGLGGAGIVAGAIAGGLAIAKKGDLDDNCPGGECPPEFHGDVDSFQTTRVVSTVGLIAGGVLAAGGVVLVLTAPGGDDGGHATVKLHVQPAGVGLSGRF